MRESARESIAVGATLQPVLTYRARILPGTKEVAGHDSRSGSERPGSAWRSRMRRPRSSKGSRTHSEEEFIEVATLLERSKMLALFLDRWAREFSVP